MVNVLHLGLDARVADDVIHLLVQAPQYHFLPLYHIKSYLFIINLIWSNHFRPDKFPNLFLIQICLLKVLLEGEGLLHKGVDCELIFGVL